MKGKAGACPEWYPLIRAARYLGVPPWELAEQSYVWQEWALAAESAEIEAQQDTTNHVD
jgi:uncharacterized protein Usg